MNDNNLITILITYKNKLLLLSPDIILPKNSDLALWGLIYGRRTSKWSDNDLVKHTVKYTTGLVIETVRIQPITFLEGSCMYHVELNDKDVNSMERRIGQRLEFFEREELTNIHLNSQTKKIISQYSKLLQELLV